MQTLVVYQGDIKAEVIHGHLTPCGNFSPLCHSLPQMSHAVNMIPSFKHVISLLCTFFLHAHLLVDII